MALVEVGSKMIEKSNLIAKEQIVKLARVAVKTHHRVEELSEMVWQAMSRRIYLTPSMFIDYIRTFLQLLERKQKELNLKKRTL